MCRFAANQQQVSRGFATDQQQVCITQVHLALQQQHDFARVKEEKEERMLCRLSVKMESCGSASAVDTLGNVLTALTPV